MSDVCQECGMTCEPGEYHPFAACLMFKGCQNSKTVRANLSAPPGSLGDGKSGDGVCQLSQPDDLPQAAKPSAIRYMRAVADKMQDESHRSTPEIYSSAWRCLRNAADALEKLAKLAKPPNAERLLNSIPLQQSDGQEDAALDLLEAAKNTLYGIFKGDPHATHNAANMRNRIDVFLQGRQIDRLAARQQPLAATEWRVCRTCNGTGNQLHTSDAQCKTCKGRGIEAAPKGATDTSGTEVNLPSPNCPYCGKVKNHPTDTLCFSCFKERCGAPDGEPGKSANSPQTDEPR